jgi:Tfp pilus assembly protein PilF
VGFSWESPSKGVFSSVIPLASELPRLVVLLVLTAAAFVGTRWLAVHERARQLDDAVAWRARGSDALRAGDLDGAITAFRHAAAMEPSNRASAVGLAETLIRSGQNEEAERILGSLRTREPDDADVNVKLARIAAGRGDPATAARYYEGALYALSLNPAQRLKIRLEFGEYLLARHQTSQALPELIAAIPDVAERPAQRLRLAEMLATAGEARLALQEFQGVLAVDPRSGRALTGAGTAAFKLGRYSAAATYLRQAPPGPGVDRLLNVATNVVARDPLAPYLREAERHRRVLADLGAARARLRRCLEMRANGGTADALRASADELDASMRRNKRGRRDAIEESLAVIDRAERTSTTYCPDADPVDQALAIVARLQIDTP